MTTSYKERLQVLERLTKAGISFEDAHALRRISMTLHRWYELECGDGNDYGSWAIERDEATDKPYMVHHHYLHGKGKDYVTRTPLSDKENGAIKRLGRIMSRYSTMKHYLQTDPRGASLYILPAHVLEHYKDSPIDSIYNNGIAVY